MQKKSLKEQNHTKLILFLIFNISILVCSFGSSIDFESIELNFQTFTSKESLLTILSPLIIIVLNGILSSDLKHILVFWRFKNVLPGHRVFTKLAPKDARINLVSIEKKHGLLPESPKEQNQKWYKIYSKYKNDTVISNSHKVFLLTRDLTGIAMLFFISSPAILFTDAIGKVKFLTILYFLIQYLILSIVSRNYGNRFACNVLAIDSNA